MEKERSDLQESHGKLRTGINKLQTKKAAGACSTPFEQGAGRISSG